MKKVKLDAESLRVETFDVESIQPALRGTVQGQADTRFASGCASCMSCDGDCSSYPNACFCTENVSCWCQ